MREYYWYLFLFCYPIGMFPVWLCYLLPTARRWPKVTFYLIPTVGAIIAILMVELMCRAYDSEQQTIEVGRGGVCPAHGRSEIATAGVHIFERYLEGSP